MLEEPQPHTRADPTRAALLDAAALVFSEAGFDAASTRAIAQAAGVNQALIAYHFGGKQGIYMAVFERMAAEMTGRVHPLIDLAEQSLSGVRADKDETELRRHSLEVLKGLASHMATMMASEETIIWSRLILREQQFPTDAFTLIYDNFMGRVLGFVTTLIQGMRPGLRLDECKLLAITIMAQAFIFRAAHAGVLRHMNWQDIGDAEVALITARISSNIDLLLGNEVTP